MAFTAVSMEPWPEIIMTCVVGTNSFTRRKASSPSISGIQMSRIMRSGGSVPYIFNASIPLAATDTSYPSSSRMLRRDVRIASSSSTTRIDADITPFSLPHALHRTILHRQIERKDGSLRMVVPHMDLSFVICDNPADDRQPQPGSRLLTSKIRHKQPFLILRRNAGPFVRHGADYATAFRIILRPDPQPPFLIHRLNRVVEEIDEHTPQLFPVEIDGRQILVQVHNQFNIFLGF